MYDALFLGSIGVLVETTDMQRRAFNAAFEEAGLDWHWSPEDYLPMLRKSGGRARIERYANAMGDTVDAEALHASKVRHFAQMMQKQGLELRPGVGELIEAAKSKGMKVAFVTSTGADQIDAIFKALNGALTRESFDYVGDRRFVDRSKPAPDIYLDALQTLNLNARDVLAIEDTPICADAALAARIATLGFANDGVGDQPFPDGVTEVKTLSPDLLQRDVAVA
ncbi:HAD-IA family hydrolase [Marivita hallyeonensis]|uniref:Haloacid dehalogenase superfamily, subfamily IA, variant 3 with third motif having DD or ED n=1 Tax=Marivita hallyeonensis TaxID=996342 RepID=A0A1M5UL84_9RHOB|nr:HAD-IA family hydrolase [Marivita hallyeonensis]SHH63731.1 haloacid dehalogenase superfamily, subfamily IA, variant 3 with third motif having DD or ED [Marivita hallyeonensis]